MARDYKREYANYHSRPDQIKRRAARNAARRAMRGRKELTDEKDVHHKDNNPMNNDKSNIGFESVLTEKLREIVHESQAKVNPSVCLVRKHIQWTKKTVRHLHEERDAQIQVWIGLELETNPSW
jgi:hypothetical protein